MPHHYQSLSVAWIGLWETMGYIYVMPWRAFTTQIHILHWRRKKNREIFQGKEWRNPCTKQEAMLREMLLNFQQPPPPHFAPRGGGRKKILGDSKSWRSISYKNTLHAMMCVQEKPLSGIFLFFFLISGGQKFFFFPSVYFILFFILFLILSLQRGGKN